MKKTITFAFILALALSAAAQYKISPAGRHALARYRAEAAQSRAATPIEPTVAMLVRVNDENAARLLTEAGYNVTSDIGPIAIVEARLTDAERIAALEKVSSISFGKKRRMLMKSARQSTAIDDVHDGIGIGGQTYAFTGNGVIIGLMDGGLYPNHINFKGRVQRLWHFDYDNNRTNSYTASTIGNFTTDDATETHATHVAGIMAGGYMGDATFHADGNSTSGSMPHYGVAPDAELAFSCGDLYDEYIIQGVKNIIDYAEEQGKPVAINLSLGSNDGPHDGTDDFSAALDELGKRAIICVAAGNEGASDLSIEKTFTTTDRTVHTLLYYNNNYYTSNYGSLDIWSDSATPLTVTIGNADSHGTITNETQIPTSTGNDEQQITRGVRSSSYYSGGVYVSSGIDANNGRHRVMFFFDEALPSSGRFVITVSGQAGQTVNMWFDGSSTFTNHYNPSSDPLEGFTKGSPDGSISGMACGKNVVSIGAYSTANTWTKLDGSAGHTYETPGACASFSSYGRDFFGRKLPEVAAPGTALISSFSTSYIAGGHGDQYGESASDMVVSAKNASATDYWGPMEGTSMACPVATGTMGLWLQADPTLTIDDVHEIISKTSTRDSFVDDNPDRFGAGKLNATKGIEYILAKASIENIDADADTRVTMIPQPGGYRITVAGASGLTAELFDLQGRKAASIKSDSNRLNLTTSTLASGIYILRLGGQNLNYSTKIVVGNR